MWALMSRDWLTGAGPGTDYELWLVNNHLVDPLDHGQALAAAINTGSVGYPLTAVHHKQLEEWLRDEDLAAR